MSNYKFIVTGGGTGGHIYPAIAIANTLKKRYPDAEFLFVGARDKMEMTKVPQAGYNIEGLWISGLQRKLSLKNFLFPLKIISSLRKASRILKKFRPHVVIGTGGFASWPVMRAAIALGIPCVVQEQNSFPGIANKSLAKKVERVFVAYEGMERYFPQEKIVKTGNPVRQDILDVHSVRGEARQHFHLNENQQTLLVLGGSLGARRMNELIAEKLEFFKACGLRIIWQCGKLYYETYKKYDADEAVQVHAFLDRMELAYAAADVIISRAGAGAIAELCIVGKPTVFIPSPNVAEDHQTKNAMAVSGKGAAIMVRENELDTEFEKEFGAMMRSEEERKKMAEKLRALALPEATERIADGIMDVIKKGDD